MPHWEASQDIDGVTQPRAGALSSQPSPGLSPRSLPHPHGHNVSVTRMILLGRISSVYFLMVMNKFEGCQICFSRTCSEKRQSRTKSLAECSALGEKTMGTGLGKHRDVFAVSRGSLQQRVAPGWSCQATHQGWAVQCPCSIGPEQLGAPGIPAVPSPVRAPLSDCNSSIHSPLLPMNRLA